MEESERLQSSRWARSKSYIQGMKIHTEPVVFLQALTMAIRGVLAPHLSEAKMRRTYLPPAGLTPAELKVFYNKKMILWEQYFSFVNSPITCLVGILYGAYSDKRGRKWPILLGVLSNFIDNAIRILVWWEAVDLDLNWLFADAAINGLLGGAAMVLVNAYVVDKFKERNALSARMVIFSASFSAGIFVGAQLAEILVANFQLDHITVMFTAQGIVLTTILVGWILLDNQPPLRTSTTGISVAAAGATTTPTTDSLLEERRDELERSETGHGGGGGEERGNILSMSTMLREGVKSFRDSLRIFTRDRQPSVCRLFLCMCFFVNFLDQLIFAEESALIGIYTRLAPFSWDTQEYGLYKSVRPIIQLGGMMFGVVVLKKWLKLRDTTMIILCIISMGSAALVIGLAASSTLIYLSLLAGSLHGLLTPLAYTFLSYLVLPDEVGKTFALTTIAVKASNFVQAVVLQSIYTATVEWYQLSLQNFIWLLLAGLSLLAAMLYTVVHVIAKRNGVGQ